ncbi:NADH dehydrogenase I chain L [Salmonella enterica subsp. enterica]|uniref:NADH dehydrogenase I chain L n=1 Tax=Salmonella enterica I TaxID=59201 RepID=A0A447TZ71_SALET|nr:NADH dehydrogenase I chain L [Salmonella enterica subsp. enterica]
MNMLALTIILPLIGFVLLAFSRGRWSEKSLRDHWRGLRWSGGVGDSVCRDGFLRQRQTGVQPAAVDVDVGR